MKLQAKNQTLAIDCEKLLVRCAVMSNEEIGFAIRYLATLGATELNDIPGLDSLFRTDQECVAVEYLSKCVMDMPETMPNAAKENFLPAIAKPGQVMDGPDPNDYTNARAIVGEAELVDENVMDKDYYFDQFWSLYPRKKDKVKCRASWDRHNYDEIATDILVKLCDQIDHDRIWMTRPPYPTTYLNKRLWEKPIIKDPEAKDSTVADEAPTPNPPADVAQDALSIADQLLS